MKVKSFRPTKGKVFVTDLDEGVHRTKGGIILTNDVGTETGIRPRWARVIIVADDVDYIAPGEWVLIEHGRWTQRLPFEIEGQDKFDMWMIDPDAILVVSDKNESEDRITF